MKNKIYAGFWLRFVAIIIDGLVFIPISIVTIPLLIPLFVLFPALESVDFPWPKLLNFFMSWFYFAGMESSSMQATVGKLALGIKVTDSHGKRVTFARATARHFAKVLSSFTLGIGYIMAAFTSKKQALHDIIADCLVVKE